MKKKTPRQRQIERMDKMFSEIIRRRAIMRVGGCEYSLKPKYDKEREDGTIYPAWKQLQCSHFIGRGNLHTRWDLDNAIGANGNSHMKLEHNPPLHKNFFLKHIGTDRVERLENLSQQNGKVDLDSIENMLKESLKRWRDNERTL